MRKLLTFLAAVAFSTMAMSAQDLYLMGYGNVWDTQASCKFTETDGVYKLHIGKLDGNTLPYGFKIARVNEDAQHTWAQEWGAAEQVRIDTPVKCEAGNEGNNFYLPSHYDTQNIWSLESATLIFDAENETLLIDPDLYLAGECTNWDNTSYEWRFTNEGNGIHTLSNKTSVNGNFKITAGAKEAWTVEYGGAQNMTSGQTYSLIPGQGNDMSISGSFTKITVDRNANTITITADNAGGGNNPVNPPVEPDPNERGPELYLMGEWNSWSPDQEAFHFTQHNICEYVLEVPSLSGEFKVTSPGWQNQFGCDTPLEIGKTYSCVRADNGHNMTLAQGSGTNVTITFDYKNQTIKVDCMPALYLVGDFNNWVPTQQYQFSLVDGMYTLRTKNFTGEFRIESIDGSVKFGGTDLYDEFELDQEYSILHNSEKNFSFNGLKNPDNHMLITVNPNASGISSISPSVENDNDTSLEAEYYTLQGIKVSNPSHGIYIRKKGNKVEKTAIK